MPTDRRTLIKALGSLPLATILADPVLAQEAAATTRPLSIATPSGRSISGALALPAQLPAPVLILIHEFWGLNDQIKAVAADFAAQGYVALAVDLYGGQLAENADQARALMSAVDAGVATETLTSWIAWGRQIKEGNGKLATVGWCFGGGWSLNASVAAPVDATVLYYGRCNLPTADLAHLKGPVLGHFGTRDHYINKEMVDVFEAHMKEAGKPYHAYWYEADHAFANPTGNNFHKEDAQLAWGRTLAFLRENLA